MPALQQQRGSDAALQVDFEEDIDDEAEAAAIAVQPKPSRAAKVLPRAVAAAQAGQRPKLKVRATSAQACLSISGLHMAVTFVRQEADSVSGWYILS